VWITPTVSDTSWNNEGPMYKIFLGTINVRSHTHIAGYVFKHAERVVLIKLN